MNNIKVIKKIIFYSILFGVSSVQAKERCYILGDSIAQGVSQFSSQCSSSTKVGLNTKDARDFFTSKGVLHFENLVISLGINDKGQPEKTIQNLTSIRYQMRAKKVIWILPNENHKEQNKIVKNVATYFGDSYIDVTSVIGKDGIHPTISGYKLIADSLNYYY